MKKFIFLTAALLLLCSCSGATLEVIGEPKTLSLSMQEGMSSYAKDAVRLFGEKVESISQGELKVEITESDDPLRDLDAGCDLVFGPNTLLARANSDFSAYTSPFYFSGYQHMTMTLNSGGFQSLTEEKTQSLMNAKQLGAFYDGSSVLVTVRPEGLSDPTELEGLKIYLNESEALGYLLGRLGANVVVKTPDQIREGFLEGMYQNFEWDKLDLESLSIPVKGKPFTVCESFHTARINWMMLSATTLQNLSDREYAVLKEALAYALAQNDGAVLAKEEAGLEYIQSIGCETGQLNYGDFTTLADEVLSESARYSNIWNWDVYREVKELSN